MIKLQSLVKQYQTTDHAFTILNAIDLEIETPDMVAIMGPSGSGKSTLMNIIGLLDRPTQGWYWLNQRLVSELTSKERAALRKHEIGFIFQSFYLLPHLTGLENVTLPLHYQGMKHGIDEKGQELMARLGVNHLAHKRPSAMSGGEQQRIAIARALIGNPRVILADEPTGALDTETGNKVLNLLRACYQDFNKTVIVVTHDPEVANCCQRTIHMRDGQIVTQANC